jgi:carbon monoxide dehydrogenase subunit G
LGKPQPRGGGRGNDPLAQSFTVTDSTGIFLTKCDIFFQTVDDTDVPVVFQIRPVQQGYPTETVLPFSEVTLNPDQITVSDNGSIATSFIFKSPVYLEGGKDYSVVLLSNSTKYRVYISRVGEEDLITQEFVTTQPYLGSLFKSQNGSTWDASQWGRSQIYSL